MMHGPASVNENTRVSTR